jgi:thiamine biosynthesis lipoprotein
MVRFAREGVELNLGAIGKGYAVGRIAARLRAAGVGQALVSAGDSSVEAVGAPPGGWPIALRGLAAGGGLRLRAGAMATSGAGEQGFVHEGVRLGHVIDPRTGWPARTVPRVTVVAPDAADADALATAFLVGGPALAERYLAAHDEVLAVFTLDGASRPHIMGHASGAFVEG